MVNKVPFFSLICDHCDIFTASRRTRFRPTAVRRLMSKSLSERLLIGCQIAAIASRLQHSVVWQKLRPIYMPSTGTKGVPKQAFRQRVGSTSGAKLSNSLKKPRCLVTGLAAPNRCTSLWRLLGRLHMAKLCPTRTISFLRSLFRSVW